MPPTRQIKQTKTASTHDWETKMELSSEQHDFGTVTVPFASYGLRGPAGRRAVVGVAAAGSVRTDVLPDRLVITN